MIVSVKCKQQQSNTTNYGKCVVFCEDAQFDSTRYSAKYCSYTIMECRTNKVVDFSTLLKYK